MATLVCLLAPTNIGQARTAFYLTALRHALPESLIFLTLSLLILLLPRTFVNYGLSALSMWRSAFTTFAFQGRWRNVATIAPLLIVFVAMCGSIYFMKDYARARYSYWIKDGLQQDFQTEQLGQAFQYEREYQYDIAARKYADLAEMFPVSKNATLIKERLSLNFGLVAYAERIYGMGKTEESRHGISRLALDLYLESLRINPRHVESHKRLAQIQQYIEHRIKTIVPLMQTCYERNPGVVFSPFDTNADVLTFLVDLPEKDRRDTEMMPDLCTIALRFPSNSSFLDMVKRSWQLDRLASTMNFSASVLGGKTMDDLLGKDDDSKMKSLALLLPLIRLPSSAGMDAGQRASLLSLPPLPPLPLPPPILPLH